MTPFIRNLALLLAVQLMLAIGLYLADSDQVQSEPLLPQLASADQLILKDADGDNTLLIEQVDGRWRLAANSLPVSQSKIDQLLRDLTALKNGWPVAQSREAQSRFGVGDDTYQQQLQLKQGDTLLHTLYLGDSPAFRQLHVRKDGDNAIYKVALNRYELSTEQNAWLDKQLLSLPVVDAVAQGDNALSRQQGEWQLTLNSAAQPVDSRAARELVNRLTALTVIKPAESAPLSSSINELVVKSGASEYRYQLTQQDNTPLLRRSDIAHWFEISQDSFDKLYAPDWTALIKSESDSEVVASDSTASGSTSE
jgi:hypothetical protein